MVCPHLGWLMRSGQAYKTATLGDRFRMLQGANIHIRARKLYPAGVLVEDKNIVVCCKKTQQLINNDSVSTIFEATFLIDNYVARADILKREKNAWSLIEVKSTIRDKHQHIDDIAYTAMVIERAGIRLSSMFLLLVSKDFRLGMENQKLFTEIKHTDEVKHRVEEFKPFWEPMESITRKLQKPAPYLQYNCRTCKMFSKCVGKNIEKSHIFKLPRLTEPKFNKLTKLRITCIFEIPDDFPLTERQKIARECELSKKPYIGDKLRERLNSIKWPAFYLDFESVMTAIPLYPKIAPYKKIPTQYSIHKCTEPGSIVDHKEYLADSSRDCRKELAENLIKDLEKEGSIVVYSAFEKSIIQNLKQIYPSLTGEFNGLIKRLVDLEAIIRKNFYHTDFHGRTSIKKTLPALVDDISYDGMEIADGDTAMASFGFLALGKYKGKKAETIKSRLLDYCKQDTLATVKLHKQLTGFV